VHYGQAWARPPFFFAGVGLLPTICRGVDEGVIYREKVFPEHSGFNHRLHWVNLFQEQSGRVDDE
jgi:hypothetical protein